MDNLSVYEFCQSSFSESTSSFSGLIDRMVETRFAVAGFVLIPDTAVALSYDFVSSN